jgi:hypothetical protein
MSRTTNPYAADLVKITENSMQKPAETGGAVVLFDEHTQTEEQTLVHTSTYH